MSNNKDLDNNKTENLQCEENVITDFDAAERADEIFEYYKNIPFEEDNETEENNTTQELTVFEKVKQRLNIRRDLINISQSSDEDLHEISYGLKNKHIFTYLSVASICILIIGFSLFTAVRIPKEVTAINAKTDELRSNNEYIDLKNEYESSKSEIEQLRTDISEKEEFAKQVYDYENKKASLRENIEAKKTELDELNSQITQKQAEIDSINANIEQSSSSIITLSPGRYKAGENIAAGKYSVTGAGKIVVSTKDNNNKINQVLGSSPIEITLDDGDNIKLETTAKFTSIN